jgi:hypothetical protein
MGYFYKYGILIYSEKKAVNNIDYGQQFPNQKFNRRPLMEPDESDEVEMLPKRLCNNGTQRTKQKVHRPIHWVPTVADNIVICHIPILKPSRLSIAKFMYLGV